MKEIIFGNAVWIYVIILVRLFLGLVMFAMKKAGLVKDETKIIKTGIVLNVLIVVIFTGSVALYVIF